MTATLLKAARLSQERFIGRDGRPRCLAPAERVRAFDSRAPRTLGPRGQRGGGPPQRIRVPILDELPGPVDDLRQARVVVGGDGTSARQRLEARKTETLVAAGEDETSGGRVHVDELRLRQMAEHARAGHSSRRLLAGLADYCQLQVWADLLSDRPCAQQAGRVLARVQGPDEEEVAGLQ